MNKDVIYIDVEDDITAIIGKIKASREKIVALVPPKRIGVLQSAVNLRLLARMAENGNKHLVLITNNQALIALSAIAQIPIAKNLQSKPEIAEIAALEIDEGEDIIDGAQLPVGELVKTADSTKSDDVAEVISTMDIENDTPRPSKTSSKNVSKVPDFSRFRKKLFIGLAIAPFIIWFFVWAIMFAPAAKIIITAQTSPAPVSLALKLGGTTATDISKNIIQTVSKQVIKDVSVDFDATGTKTVGEKATGALTLSNADSSDPISVPSGSIFSNGNYTFTTATSVDVPGAGVSGGEVVPGSADVNIIATQIGTEYNLSPRSYLSSVDGLTAYGAQMAGGSSRDVKIVVADDIQKAGQALVDLSSSAIKQQLIAQFTNGETVIAESFTVNHAAAVSAPLIGVEAPGGKAKLTSSTTFSIIAIAKSELESYLRDALNKQISNSNAQRIYDDGIDKVVLSGYLKTDQAATVNVATTGQIGPNIDQATIKDQAKGKRYGDVQSLIDGIQGVNSVDIKFSYFWVNTVPNDSNKIDVEFVLQNA